MDVLSVNLGFSRLLIQGFDYYQTAIAGPFQPVVPLRAKWPHSGACAEVRAVQKVQRRRPEVWSAYRWELWGAVELGGDKQKTGNTVIICYPWFAEDDCLFSKMGNPLLVLFLFGKGVPNKQIQVYNGI